MVLAQREIVIRMVENWEIVVQNPKKKSYKNLGGEWGKDENLLLDKHKGKVND